jgi:hypothetical protein
MHLTSPLDQSGLFAGVQSWLAPRCTRRPLRDGGVWTSDTLRINQSRSLRLCPVHFIYLIVVFAEEPHLRVTPKAT